MPDIIPTAEQLAIIEAATSTTDNLLVEARAGAAKTSTLIMLAEALPSTRILSLAFNKAIAVEMAERLPKNCEAKTLNALGHRVWGQYLGKRLTLNSSKNFDLLKEAIQRFTEPGSERDEISDRFSELLKAIDMTKQQGYLPDKVTGPYRRLCDEAEFFESLEFKATDTEQEIINWCAWQSFERATRGEIDFGDQVLCPAVASVSFEPFPLVLIDEAQDLSPINHVLLKKIVRNRRIIAVGDPCQAIYGFRGADTDSMNRLKALFNMKTFHLTISFRCSKAVTRAAQWRAPDMQWPDWAKEGSVQTKAAWDHDQLLDGDAVICRNNAPLFALAIKLIKDQRLPEIAGRDIAKGLNKIMKSLGRPGDTQEQALAALDFWKQKELSRARNHGIIHDKYECLKIIITETETLGDAIAYLNHLLERPGRIKLMTGHKAKGLEFDNVFFLDQHLCNIEKGQDANIKYVIETRAKENLTYVNTKGYGESEDGK